MASIPGGHCSCAWWCDWTESTQTFRAYHWRPSLRRSRSARPPTQPRKHHLL